MVDTHFCNDIRYFHNLKPYIFTAIARDLGAEIYGYGDISLAIKVGK